MGRVTTPQIFARGSCATRECSGDTKSLTAQRLRDLLLYQPSTGLWKAIAPRANNGRTVYGWHRGTPCEPRRRPGGAALQIQIDGKRYLAHRLAVFYMTGEWPIGDVIHKDGNRSNNRWLNLIDVGAPRHEPVDQHAECEQRSDHQP